MNQMQAMERMYFLQRHFYDLSRKYYLLGRDLALERLAIHGAQNVLELGCGTARNLIELGRRYPEVRLFGLDASESMLVTARKKIARNGLNDRIRLVHCLGEELDFRTTFGLAAPFDAILCSYTLSMIPTWDRVLEVALHNLKPGGRLVILDFWDQGEWPAWFRKVLQSWLRWFGVFHRPELIERVQSLPFNGAYSVNLHSHFGRYAVLLEIRKTMSDTEISTTTQSLQATYG